MERQKVYSLFSNISHAKDVYVDSIKSRIDIAEVIGNLVIFSDISNLSFPSNCSSFNLSLQNQGTFLNISNINVAVLSEIGNFSEQTSKVSNSQEVTINGNFNKNVNMKVNDGQTLFQAINGTIGSLSILTRQPNPNLIQNNDVSSLSLKANHSTTNSDKTLYIESEGTLYEIMASISGANIGISFNNLTVMLYNNYNRLTVNSKSYVFDIIGEQSNFNMRLSKELFVVYTSGNIMTMIYDLRNSIIKLIIQQPSDTSITLNNGSIETSNQVLESSFGNEFFINSSALEIVTSDNDKNFLINSNQSKIKFGCEQSVVSLASRNHVFQINNGSPNITIKLNSLNFVITIYPKIANNSLPLWISRDNFNETQFSSWSNTLDAIINNITSNPILINETYQPNIIVDKDGRPIIFGPENNQLNITNIGTSNDTLQETITQYPSIDGLTLNNNLLTTRITIGEVTLRPNTEFVITTENKVYPTPITFVTPNLMPSFTQLPSFQTQAPSISKGNEITTWQSTSNKDLPLNNNDFAVFQYNTESSKSGKITLTATISDVSIDNNNLYSTSSYDNDINMIFTNKDITTKSISSDENLVTTTKFTTLPSNLGNEFPTPSELIFPSYYNFLRKTRNVIIGETTYNAVIKRKTKLN
uniref:Peptidase S74 domain-containing protein n=1 Tax=Parastrongyloides trichosuri TaxID=131310 RepID=A0A0N5A3Q8_PARTI